MNYPATIRERTEMRIRLEEEAANRARTAARRTYLSIRCAEDDHGCSNRGTTCLCPCHDPEPQR